MTTMRQLTTIYTLDIRTGWMENTHITAGEQDYDSKEKLPSGLYLGKRAIAANPANEENAKRFLGPAYVCFVEEK